MPGTGREVEAWPTFFDAATKKSEAQLEFTGLILTSLKAAQSEEVSTGKQRPTECVRNAPFSDVKSHGQR